MAVCINGAVCRSSQRGVWRDKLDGRPAVRAGLEMVRKRLGSLFAHAQPTQGLLKPGGRNIVHASCWFLAMTFDGLAEFLVASVCPSESRSIRAGLLWYALARRSRLSDTTNFARASRKTWPPDLSRIRRTPTPGLRRTRKTPPPDFSRTSKTTAPSDLKGS